MGVGDGKTVGRRATHTTYTFANRRATHTYDQRDRRRHRSTRERHLHAVHDDGRTDAAVLVGHVAGGRPGGGVPVALVGRAAADQRRFPTARVAHQRHALALRADRPDRQRVHGHRGRPLLRRFPAAEDGRATGPSAGHRHRGRHAVPERGRLVPGHTLLHVLPVAPGGPHGTATGHRRHGKSSSLVGLTRKTRSPRVRSDY